MSISDRPRRVPPPPPPGFGDDDYYKLYGEPEEYQKYREELNEKLKWKGDKSPPQHEEYYVYRRYKSYEESYDYYCGPRQGERDLRDEVRPPKRRIAPPPPPGFEDDSPIAKRGRRRKETPPPRLSPKRKGKEEEGSASGSESCQVFKNFRVTIKNDSDGTPSLSESDEDNKKGKRKRKRKRKDREREKRKKLEKKLKKREEELAAVKETRGNMPDLREDLKHKREKDAARGSKPSVIDRLGERPLREGERRNQRGNRGSSRGRKESPARKTGSVERTRREDLVRRAELRKERRESPGAGKGNKERSPLRLGRRNRSASPGRRREGAESKNRGRNRRSIARGSRSRSVGRNSRSRPGRTKSEVSRGAVGRKRSKSKDRRSLSDLRKRRSRSRARRSLSRGRVTDSRSRRRRNRSKTPLTRAGVGTTGGRRKKNKKKKRRRGGGGELRRMDKVRLEDMKEENEEMRAKLLAKRKKGGDGNQEGLLDRLAQMAGQTMPDNFKQEGEGATRKSRSRSGSSSSGESRSSSGSSSEDEYDSDSEEENEKSRGGKRKFFWDKENGGKMKSDSVGKGSKKSSSVGRGGKKSDKEKENDEEAKEVKEEKKRGSSPEKWKHDKFMETQLSPKKEREEAFGSHWSKIRSERSKERERNRSQSRSRSRSRSATPRRSRRRRRRGKFSRSPSSSSSGSSRSWSSSRHSSYSSGREHTKSRSKSKSPSRAAGSGKAKPPVAVVAATAVVEVKEGETAGGEEVAEGGKEGVNLGLSGALAAETNTVNGIVVKYSEPPEARKPKKKWRLYVFKGNEELPILYIHRQSAYLLGRDRKVADIPLDHPSCSKQHAALQYRLVNYTKADGSSGRRVQLYIMDLGSANGTFVNNSRIESQKYIQLLEKDVLKFGFSSREYVLLHDQSKEDEDDQGVD